MPFGKGKPIGGGWHPALDFVLGGWTVNANSTLSKGWSFDYPNAGQNPTNTPWFPRVIPPDVQNASFGVLDPVRRNLPRWLKLGLVLNW